MNYEQELTNLKNAQQRAAVADLANTRDTTLNNLQTEQIKNANSANQQRNAANVANRMNAKNFQEYLASTGRANTGISAQANLQNRNNLTTQMNNITSAENATNNDINRQITLANNAYNNGLSSANATIEANYIQNLLDQRNKELERQMQQKQFDEQVRQFNEQLALDKQKLYSNFNSGSSSNNNTINTTSDEQDFTDTSKQQTTNNSNVGTGTIVNNKSTTKSLNKLKWDGKSIGEIRTSQGGTASVKLYKSGNNYYYKTNNGWYKYA